MLVGDIYGERDYTSIGLSATTIASSFGKVRLCAMLLWRSGQMRTSVAGHLVQGLSGVSGHDQGSVTKGL